MHPTTGGKSGQLHIKEPIATNNEAKGSSSYAKK